MDSGVARVFYSAVLGSPSRIDFLTNPELPAYP